MIINIFNYIKDTEFILTQVFKGSYVSTLSFRDIWTKIIEHKVKLGRRDTAEATSYD